MNKNWLVGVLLIHFYAVKNIYSSHFRGAVIMVKPKLGGAAKEMEISYQISWTQSSSRKCNSTTVADGGVIKSGGALSCQYGCSDTIMSQMLFICTYYSIEDNWLFGEYHTTYDFSNVTDQNTVTIGYESYAWIDAIGGRWNVSTTFSVVRRTDTGQINSSPQVLPTTPLYLQQGCSYTIPLPISDPDNDTVQCRWAVGTECKGICNKLPGAFLSSATCTITYTANYGTGIKGVAVMVEDYIPGSLYRPLSSVALQFLISVYYSSQPCPTQTEYFKFPSITLHPLNKTVIWNQYKESHNLTLTCMANESVSYYWEKQNDSVPYNSIGIHSNTLTLIDVQPEDTGNYRCAAFNSYSVCCRSFSDYAAVTIINVSSPVLTSYPTPQHVDLTQIAIFTCNAIGYDVSYQWRIGSGSFPNKVTGINSNTLMIPDVRSSDDNTYTCVASNEEGNVSSNATRLTVTGLPEVLIISSALMVEVTETIIFTAAVTGIGPFNYQWQKEGYNITNKTGSTFTIHNVSSSDQANYSCFISNDYGDSVVSNTIRLQVTRNLPVIAKNPISTFIIIRNNFTSVSLTCKVDGASSYLWQRQHGNIPSRAIGVNTGNLTLINLQLKDTGSYRCVGINGSGSTASEYATLTFEVSPSKIVTQPTDTSAAVPFSGVFTCSVIGYGYQNITWYKPFGTLPQKYMTNEMTSGGVTTSTLIIPNVTKEDVGKYYCQVWANNIGVRSEKAYLYFSGIPLKPVVAVQPGQLINLTANNLNLSMQCGRYSEDFNYHWEKKNDMVYLRAQGVNFYQLIITNLTVEDSGEYRCAMSNSTGKIFSDYSLVTIKVVLPTITRQPSSTVVEVNNIATFECSVRSYGTASITWKKLKSKLPATANAVVTKSLNQITSVLRIEKTIGYYEGYYYCISENSVGQVNSSFAYCKITVPCPEMIIPPEPVVVRPDTMVTFSCLAWSYGGLEYRWIRNDSSILPSNSTYSGRSNTVYELSISNVQIMDEGPYCCVVSNECGNITKCTWLEVDTTATITVQPQHISLKCKEKNVQAFWIVATGLGHIYYQWQKYNPFTNSWILPSSRVVNITSPNLTFSVIIEEDQGMYRCIVTNDDGSVISDDGNITVYGSPSILYHSSSEIVAFEGDKLNLMCNATNDEDSVGSVQISWYNGTQPLKPDGKRVIIYNKYDNTTDQLCSLLLFDPVNHTDDGKYICRAFTYPFCYTENKINVTVEYAPRITIDPPQSPYLINVGTKLILHCIAEGLPIPTIQWYRNGVPVSQQSSPFYLVSTDFPSTTVYTCEGKNNGGSKENIANAKITVTVKKIEKCPTLSDPDNGKMFVISDGRVTIFTCKNGFVTIGNSYLQCINGIWSSPPPKCQAS